MATAKPLQRLDQSFDQIEKLILPGVSALLDNLLDAALLARSGKDGEAFAADLQILTNHLEAVTRHVEALSLNQFQTENYREIIAAEDRKISA